MGPILFNIYFSTLCSLQINGKIISYADDTAIVFKGTTWNDLKSYVISGFKLVKICLDTFKLSLNIAKPDYIVFSVTNLNSHIFNSMDGLGVTIKEVVHTKHLGIGNCYRQAFEIG